VAACSDFEPVHGFAPHLCPRCDGTGTLDVYSRENSLVRFRHQPSNSLYSTAAPGFIAAGITTAQTAQRATARLLELDAAQQLDVARAAARRRDDFARRTALSAVGERNRLPGLGLVQRGGSFSLPEALAAAA
jgi:hypothetical protein